MKEANDEKKKNRGAIQQKQTAPDETNSAPTKRRKGESSLKETLETPEGLKQVPGMIGLSVDFVKTSLNNGDESDENICSDELPRGR